MAVISKGTPRDREHALELTLEEIVSLLRQLLSSSPDVISITDDNGIERIRVGAQDDGSWGIRIYTGDPTDPNHMKWNLT